MSEESRLEMQKSCDTRHCVKPPIPLYFFCCISNFSNPLPPATCHTFSKSFNIGFGNNDTQERKHANFHFSFHFISLRLKRASHDWLFALYYHRSAAKTPTVSFNDLKSVITDALSFGRLPRFNMISLFV